MPNTCSCNETNSTIVDLSKEEICSELGQLLTKNLNNQIQKIYKNIKDHKLGNYINVIMKNKKRYVLQSGVMPTESDFYNTLEDGEYVVFLEHIDYNGFTFFDLCDKLKNNFLHLDKKGNDILFFTKVD